MWRARFAAPRSIASTPPSGSPPWCFSAFTVATRTIALGAMPPTGQTMSRNFSMPMSEPKPDSVTT